jgi:hypothetical protein
MGDRYDKLRLNHFDMGNNQGILEKGMLTLADNLICKSLKTIDWKGSMGQHLPVLVKMYYIIEAAKAEIKLIKERIVKEKCNQCIVT